MVERIVGFNPDAVIAVGEKVARYYAVGVLLEIKRYFCIFKGAFVDDVVEIPFSDKSESFPGLIDIAGPVNGIIGTQQCAIREHDACTFPEDAVHIGDIEHCTIGYCHNNIIIDKVFAIPDHIGGIGGIYKDFSEQ
jgi:hypothetical protein